MTPPGLCGSGGDLSVEIARERLGLDVARIAEGDSSFFDIHTIRRRHVARVVVNGLRLRDWGGSGTAIPVAVHLLFHTTRFFVMRFTVASDAFGPWRPSTGAEFRCLSNAVWGTATLSWILPAAGDAEVETGVRDVMDILFLAMCGRGGPGARVEAGLAVARRGASARYDVIERLTRRGVVLSPYPVVFGTHYEFGWDDEPRARLQRAEACSLARGDEMSGLASLDGRGGKEWLLGENQSVLLGVPRSFDSELAAFDPLRTQLVEYLTLQRGALRWVQRASQEAITEASPVERKQVAVWTRVVGALTDDYILHDQVAAILEPVQRHLTEERGVRDPQELERQVRSNLQTFTAALDAGTERAGVVLGLLFGIVAALALTDPLQRLLAIALDLRGGAEAVRMRHPVVSLVVDIALVVAFACTSAFVYLRSSRPEGWGASGGRLTPRRRRDV